MMRAAVALWLLAPTPVWACSTCFDPKDDRQSNFLGPTIFMTLMPLTMFGLIGLWVWSAYRRAERGDPSKLTPLPTGAGPRA